MRKEKYIKTKQYKGNTYFTVQFNYKQCGKSYTYSKTFNAADFPSPAQALNAAAQHRDLKRAELITSGLPTGDMTVAEAYEKSLTMYKRASGTEQNMNYTFNRYIRDQYGHMNMKDIDNFLITAQLESLKDQVSDGVLSRILTLWKRICKTAKALHATNQLATDTVEKPQSTVIVEERRQDYTDEETELVINAIRTADGNEDCEYNRMVMIAMIIVSRYAGLRPQELKAIHRDDIDFDKNILHIWRSVGYDGLKNTKNRISIRDVPLTTRVRTELMTLMVMSPYEYIFMFAGGYWPSPSTISNRFGYYARKAKVPGWHLYSQRHSFDSELILANIDPRTVMELMGHSNPTTTLKSYARSNAQKREEALDTVEKSRNAS